MMEPFPDKDYFLYGEIYIGRPTDATSATSTTQFDKLFAESLPWIKQATLDRVLTNHKRHDAAIHSLVMSELETLFPEYQDLGDPNDEMGYTDVNRDTEYLLDGREDFIGGSL